jgi:hypothetical protein
MSINDIAGEDDPLYDLTDAQQRAVDVLVRMAEANAKSESKALKRDLRQFERELVDKDARIAAMSYFNKIPRNAPKVKGSQRPKHPSGTATAVFLASDWHIEESVDPKAVGGYNKYSLDVAWARARQYFQSVVWLLKAKRHEARIDDVVIGLLGDFITGLIPMSDPSLLREVGPTRAASIAQEMLDEGLRFVGREAGARRIIVPCLPGNHGRLTMKPSYSRGSQWNLERYMLGELARGFKGDKQFEFVTTDDFCVILDIEGLRVRFSHGDNVKYAGGVGGITVPLNKARLRWNATPGGYADLDCMGHFHQAFDGGSFVVNGSLIGMTGYARKGGFEYQPPEQVGFLVRPENPKAALGSRGKVDTYKVFVTGSVSASTCSIA